MARTLEEIEASNPQIDRAKIEATTEADIRRHMIEDGHDPDAPPLVYVKRRPGQRGPGKKPPKALISLRVEQDVLDAYKATGAGWQGRMQEALRSGVATASKRRA